MPKARRPLPHPRERVFWLFGFFAPADKVRTLFSIDHHADGFVIYHGRIASDGAFFSNGVYAGGIFF
jgi:hypothetical protein